MSEYSNYLSRVGSTMMDSSLDLFNQVDISISDILQMQLPIYTLGDSIDKAIRYISLHAEELPDRSRYLLPKSEYLSDESKMISNIKSEGVSKYVDGGYVEVLGDSYRFVIYKDITSKPDSSKLNPYTLGEFRKDDMVLTTKPSDSQSLGWIYNGSDWDPFIPINSSSQVSRVPSLSTSTPPQDYEVGSFFYSDSGLLDRDGNAIKGSGLYVAIYSEYLDSNLWERVSFSHDEMLEFLDKLAEVNESLVVTSLKRMDSQFSNLTSDIESRFSVGRDELRDRVRSIQHKLSSDNESFRGDLQVLIDNFSELLGSVSESKSVIDTWISNPELVRGPKGDRGYSSYELYKVLVNPDASFNEYLESLKGDKGDVGSGIEVKGVLDSKDQLPKSPEMGDCYVIGTFLNIWNGESWSEIESIGPPGPKGEDGSPGPKGDSLVIVGTLKTLSDLPTPPKSTNHMYVVGGNLYRYEVSEWVLVCKITGSPGLSAFDEWKVKTNNYSATYRDFLDSLQGAGLQIAGSVSKIEDIPSTAPAGSVYLVQNILYAVTHKGLRPFNLTEVDWIKRSTHPEVGSEVGHVLINYDSEVPSIEDLKLDTSRMILDKLDSEVQITKLDYLIEDNSSNYLNKGIYSDTSSNLVLSNGSEILILNTKSRDMKQGTWVNSKYILTPVNLGKAEIIRKGDDTSKVLPETFILVKDLESSISDIIYKDSSGSLLHYSKFLTERLATKQDKLVPGNNITISPSNIISAKDTIYDDSALVESISRIKSEIRQDLELMKDSLMKEMQSELESKVDYSYLSFRIDDKVYTAKVVIENGVPKIVATPVLNYRFYGEVPSRDLISGLSLAGELGLLHDEDSNHTVVNSAAGWMKFLHNGKIIYVAKKHFITGISRDQLDAKDLIYGNSLIDIGDDLYRVRLLRGISSDYQSDPSIPQEQFESSSTHESEWNQLLCSLSDLRPNKWVIPDNIDESLLYEVEKSYTSQELDAKFTATWCQETTIGSNSSPNGLLRGGTSNESIEASLSIAPTSLYSKGWRPALELVDSTDLEEDFSLEELANSKRYMYDLIRDQERLANKDSEFIDKLEGALLDSRYCKEFDGDEGDTLTGRFIHLSGMAKSITVEDTLGRTRELEDITGIYELKLLDVPSYYVTKIVSYGTHISYYDLGADTEKDSFLGEVSSTELISGDDLASKINLTAGESINSDAGWLKFMYKGKIQFVAKKHIRNTIAWTELKDADLVYGDKIIEIKGLSYKVRLLRGIGEDVQPDPKKYQPNFEGKACHHSEWNDLMCPISDEAPTRWTYPDNVNSPTLKSEKTYTGDELDMWAHRTWCQELAGNADNHIVVRGAHRTTSFSTSIKNTNDLMTYSWRPVLELVE